MGRGCGCWENGEKGKKRGLPVKYCPGPMGQEEDIGYDGEYRGRLMRLLYTKIEVMMWNQKNFSHPSDLFGKTLAFPELP